MDIKQLVSIFNNTEEVTKTIYKWFIIAAKWIFKVLSWIPDWVYYIIGSLLLGLCCLIIYRAIKMGRFSYHKFGYTNYNKMESKKYKRSQL